MKQYVYVMQDMRDGFYKIGISADVRTRCATISRHKARQIEIVYISKDSVYNASKIESTLHKLYAKYHVYGEWFALPRNVVPCVFDEIETNIRRDGVFEKKNYKHRASKEYGETIVFLEQTYKRIKTKREILSSENDRLIALTRYLLHGVDESASEYATLLRRYSTNEDEFKNLLLITDGLISLGWEYPQIKDFITNNANKNIIA